MFSPPARAGTKLASLDVSCDNDERAAYDTDAVGVVGVEYAADGSRTQLVLR